MTFPKARLAVSACLFVGWLLFLFSVWLRSSTEILSKPQFLIAQVYVVVEVRDEQGKADPELKVEEVLWASDKIDQQLAHKTIRIADFSATTERHGFHGAGKYLVPLVKSAENTWMIAPVPRGDNRQAWTRRIYMWTPDVRAQIDDIIAAKSN
jgi:hypothetical protein